MPEIKITRFDGGMADDPQFGSSNQGGYIAGFDIGNNPQTLQPVVDVDKNGNSYVNTYGVTKVINVNGVIYGLGQATGGYAKIYKLDNFPGGASWSAPSNAEGNSGLPQDVFAYYKDYIYCITGSDKLNRYGLMSGTPSYTQGWKTFSAAITACTDSIVAVDDNLYIAYKKASSTGIARVDGTNLTEDVLLIPSELTIKGMCEYGKYLAIVADNGTYSKLFLWDLISDDVSESIDLGEGIAQSIENLEGTLVMFMYQAGGSTAPRDTYARVMTYSGGKPQPIKFIRGQYPNQKLVSFSSSAYNYKGQVYIAGFITNSDSTPSLTATPVLFRVGRKSTSFPVSLSIEQYLPTESSNGLGIKDFVFYKDNIVFSKREGTSSGSVVLYDVYTTKNANTFITGKYESIIFNGDDPSAKKQLNVVSVSYAALPSGATVTLKYRKDGETTWTTIFTDSTDGSGSHETNIIESIKLNLPTFKEIQFRLESVGGAEITGFKFKFTPLKNIYG